MNIKRLPEEERPCERAMRTGIKTLSNTELIALILHTGMRELSAIGLAEELLGAADRGLRGLSAMSPQELMRLPGIGRSKACSIAAAFELGRRTAALPRHAGHTISGAGDVAGLFMEELRSEKKEFFKNVLIDAKGHVMNIENVSIGELSSTVVHPREVFAPAVRKSAAACIFVHNHPSGDPTPSSQDIETTGRLCDAGRLLGIRVLDHIIIGDGTYTSMAARGFIQV